MITAIYRVIAETYWTAQLLHDRLGTFRHLPVTPINLVEILYAVSSCYRPDHHRIKIRSEPLKTRPPGFRATGCREPLINTEQAAVIIGIHPKTLQKYARTGLIRGIQVGKRWRFIASIIDEWIAREYAG